LSLPHDLTYGAAEPPRRERIGFHPLDPVSLVAGLLALAVAVGALLEVDLPGSVVVPAMLVAGGALGLVAALRRDP
jgi:hypothetical protein